MSKKFFFFLIPMVMVSGFFLVSVTPAQGTEFYNLDSFAKSANYDTSANASLGSIIQRIVSSGLGILAIVFFALAMYAGLRWMTAQGNEEKVTKAKDTLEAAIIGLAIMSSAYAITTFLFNKLGAVGGGEGTFNTVQNDEASGVVKIKDASGKNLDGSSASAGTGVAPTGPGGTTVTGCKSDTDCTGGQKCDIASGKCNTPPVDTDNCDKKTNQTDCDSKSPACTWYGSKCFSTSFIIKCKNYKSECDTYCGAVSGCKDICNNQYLACMDGGSPILPTLVCVPSISDPVELSIYCSDTSLKSGCDKELCKEDGGACVPNGKTPGSVCSSRSGNNCTDGSYGLICKKQMSI